MIVNQDLESMMRKGRTPSDLIDFDYEADTTSTMVISNRELTLDGVKFQWWAVGKDPSLVTVRSSIFGTLAEFTDGHPATFAEALATKIFAQHYERAAALRKASETKSESEKNKRCSGGI